MVSDWLPNLWKHIVNALPTFRKAAIALARALFLQYKGLQAWRSSTNTNHPWGKFHFPDYNSVNKCHNPGKRAHAGPKIGCAAFKVDHPGFRIMLKGTSHANLQPLKHLIIRLQKVAVH